MYAFQKFADTLPIATYIAKGDADASTLFINSAIHDITGYSKDEWLADPGLWLKCVHEEDRARVIGTYSKIGPDPQPVAYEYRLTHREGRTVWVRDNVRLVDSPEFGGRVYWGSLEDITPQKQFEQKLLESERQYWTLFHSNPIPMWIYSLASLRFLSVNTAAVAHYGYSAEEFGKMTIRDIRPQEDVPRLLDNIAHVTAGLDNAGRWRHRKRDGSIIDVNIVSHTIDFEEQRAEAVAAIDVTETIRSRRELEEQVARNEKIIEAVVIAASRTAEQRDPYTGRHQQMVSQIAAAIAKRLGWDETRIKHLTWAGMMHDIGKVAVPLEILAKPSRLSGAEMLLIREHVRVGFEILRGIGLPESIPQAVYQHHERLDGSGYPQGLKGDQIIPEAKILAVADVLESICSHRPYRAGRGIAVALNELESNAHKLYDTNIVSVAKALVAEKVISL